MTNWIISSFFYGRVVEETGKMKIGDPLDNIFLVYGRVVEETGKMKIGDPLDRSTQHGPQGKHQYFVNNTKQVTIFFFTCYYVNCSSPAPNFYPYFQREVYFCTRLFAVACNQPPFLYFAFSLLFFIQNHMAHLKKLEEYCQIGIKEVYRH